MNVFCHCMKVHCYILREKQCRVCSFLTVPCAESAKTPRKDDKINRRQTDRQQVDEGAATMPRLGHILHHRAERVQQLRLHSCLQNHQVYVNLKTTKNTFLIKHNRT